MRILVVLVLLPLAAFAQAEPTAPPIEAAPPSPVVTATPPPEGGPQPVHRAVPVPRSWNIGAGISFPLGGLSFAGVPTLAGSLPSSVPESSALPRLTILIERRLSDRMFLTFNAGATYGANQSETFSALSSRRFSLKATAGVRGVLNPGGVIEVSLFGNAGVAYTNYEYRTLLQTFDSMGMTVQTPQAQRGNGYTVGGAAGLTLERELISGLALRLSTSVLGFSFSGASTRVTVQDITNTNETRGGDVGLRFSPAIELRYAL